MCTRRGHASDCVLSPFNTEGADDVCERATKGMKNDFPVYSLLAFSKIGTATYRLVCILSVRYSYGRSSRQHKNSTNLSGAQDSPTLSPNRSFRHPSLSSTPWQYAPSLLVPRNSFPVCKQCKLFPLFLAASLSLLCIVSKFSVSSDGGVSRTCVLSRQGVQKMFMSLRITEPL